MVMVHHINGMQTLFKCDGDTLSAANLSRAELASASLADTDLSNANLRGVDLCNADLGRARLAGATLTGADLTLSDCSGANFDGACLDDARRQAIHRSARGPSASRFRGANCTRASRAPLRFARDFFRGCCAAQQLRKTQSPCVRIVVASPTSPHRRCDNYPDTGGRRGACRARREVDVRRALRRSVPTASTRGRRVANHAP